MRNSRTTSNLLKTALCGSNSAGHDVVAADIHAGGFIRIYFTDPAVVGKLLKVDATCDEIFETRSG